MTRIHPVYRTPQGLADDLRTRLLEEGNAILGTVNPNGSPHLTELLFSLDEHDRVHLPTPHATRKVKNVQARPVATFFVSMDGGGWVSCTGPARVIMGQNAARINEGIRERLMTEAGLATIGLLLAAHEDTTIEITPEKWLSWNSAEIMPGIIEVGGDIEAYPPDTWFKDLKTED